MWFFSKTTFTVLTLMFEFVYGKQMNPTTTVVIDTVGLHINDILSFIFSCWDLHSIGRVSGRELTSGNYSDKRKQ